MGIEFSNNFISNEEIKSKVHNNPSYLFNIWPTPKHAIEFSFDDKSEKCLISKIQVEYGIIGKFKMPYQFKMTEEEKEKLAGIIFTEVVTLSKYEIISPVGYFYEPDFPYCKEIEDELVNVSMFAVKYNSSLLKEKLKETEIPNYEIIEMTESFVRIAVRHLFFGGTGS